MQVNVTNHDRCSVVIRKIKGKKEEATRAGKKRSTTIDVDGEQEQSGWFIGDEELTRHQQAKWSLGSQQVSSSKVKVVLLF